MEWVSRSQEIVGGHNRWLMERRTEDRASVESWVAALQAGEETEANSRRIFRHYYSWVRGFFERRLGDRGNIERAEELAQETFLEAFRQIQSFRWVGTFDSWLFAIAANQLRNERRRLSQKKRDAEVVELAADGSERLPAELAVGFAGSPEKLATSKQQLQRVLVAIERLPEQQQSCLRLSLVGYDYGKIGELLKIAPSTARVHVHAARKRLRGEFPDLDDWLE